MNCFAFVKVDVGTHPPSWLAWYEQHALSYAQRTLDGGPQADRDTFVKAVGTGARVLDVGCGAGRDLRAFADAGLQAEGLEASSTLAAWAKRHAGVQVTVGFLEDVSWDQPFDGVWACASLVHVPCAELARPLDRLAWWLKPGGWLWFSVRHTRGNDEGPDSRGRYACSEVTLDEALRVTGRLDVRSTQLQNDDAPGMAGEDRADWWVVWAQRR